MALRRGLIDNLRTQKLFFFKNSGLSNQSNCVSVKSLTEVLARFLHSSAIKDIKQKKIPQEKVTPI